MMSNETIAYRGRQRIDARKSAMDFGVCLRNADQHNGEVTHIAEPWKMRPYEKGALADPCITIHDDDAQALMDSLWKAGIRPSNGEGNVGQIGAMREHLEDTKESVIWLRGVVKGQLNANTTQE